MARISIKSKVSLDGIDTIIKTLEDYKERLQWRCEIFVNRLAEVGITVAKDNILVEDNGLWINRSNLVYFEKDVASSVDGATCIIAPFSTPYISSWKKSKDGELLYAEVDPLLMAEFGSGAYAIDGHRGTFPNQKNADNPPWAWYDEYGVKHYSSGGVPSRPIYKAKEEILQQAQLIALEVFSTI